MAAKNDASHSVDERQTCIDACNACALECNHCFSACLQEPNVSMLVRCIALDAECADACRFAVAAMSRGSEHVAAICHLCAQTCDLCARECGKHQHEHCVRCAEACRECARACREMAEKTLG